MRICRAPIPRKAANSSGNDEAKIIAAKPSKIRTRARAAIRSTYAALSDYCAGTRLSVFRYSKNSLLGEITKVEFSPLIAFS